MAGAMKDLEDRQKSRATRVKRDTLDQALLELALFYRDILMLQLGADTELANPEPTCASSPPPPPPRPPCAACRPSCTAASSSPSTSPPCSP